MTMTGRSCAVSAVGVAAVVALWAVTATADTECFSTHTSGAGETYFAFCISEHGNVVQLESPEGFEHLAVGVIGEGYVLCSFEAFHGYDAGFAELGLLAPTISQPNGPNTFPLTITRDTSDGKLRLRQTFSRDNSEKDLRVTMTVTNRTALRIRAVNLHRYFDGDIDGGGTNNRYATTPDSVWGWKDGADHHGLMLTALTFSTYHFAVMERYANWDPTAGGSASSCAPNTIGDFTVPGNFVGRVGYVLGDLAAGQSKTVSVLYSRF